MRVSIVLLGNGPAPPLPGDLEVIRADSRAEGWHRSTGDRVAFLDTRYAASSGWSEAAAAAGGTIGGFVLPMEDYGWAGWLYYIVEYGWKQRLAAGNIAYAKRDEIDELDPGPGKHDPRMDVTLVHTPSFSDYVRERFRYSRLWGERHISLLAAPLRIGLPLLVLTRTPWWHRPSILPGVLVISLVMAYGEIAGSLRGRFAKVNAG